MAVFDFRRHGAAPGDSDVGKGGNHWGGRPGTVGGPCAQPHLLPPAPQLGPPAAGESLGGGAFSQRPVPRAALDNLVYGEPEAPPVLFFFFLY